MANSQTLRPTEGTDSRSIPSWILRKINGMTLLVGMVGVDGIVLAADQRMSDSATKETEFDDFIHGCKIENYGKHKMACAYAGDQFSRDIGAEIRLILDRDGFTDIGASLKRAGDQGMQKVYQTARNPASIRERTRELLVAFYGNESSGLQLWKLTVDSPPHGHPNILRAV